MNQPIYHLGQPGAERDPRVSDLMIACVLEILSDADCPEGLNELDWPLAAEICAAVLNAR
jgi:hypothetical protein